MTLNNAIKKASRFGKVVNDGRHYFVRIIFDDGSTEEIGFYLNGSGPDITCIYSKNAKLEADSMTDYFPETWHSNLTQAFTFIYNHHGMDVPGMA